MDFNIENEFISENEKEIIKKTAEDKLVEILVTFADATTRIYSGDYRINGLVSDIMIVNDQITEVDELLNSLNFKSELELKDLADRYGIKGYELFDRSALIHEVKKAIYAERSKLSGEVNNSSNNYVNNYKKTFEFFVDEKIKIIKEALTDEFNIDLHQKLEVLYDCFASIKKELNSIHQWLGVISIPATLYSDYVESLSDVNDRIKNNQSMYARSASFSELIKIRDQINQDRQGKRNIKESIAAQREALLDAFNNSNIQINFVGMKERIFKNFEIIKSNVKDLPDLDFADQIDKCIVAFNELFEKVIIKESEFKNYLDDNDIVLEEEKVTRLNMNEIFESKQYDGRTVKPAPIGNFKGESSPLVIDNSRSVVAKENELQQAAAIVPDDEVKLPGIQPEPVAQSVEPQIEAPKPIEPQVIQTPPAPTVSVNPEPVKSGEVPAASFAAPIVEGEIKPEGIQPEPVVNPTLAQIEDPKPIESEAKNDEIKPETIVKSAEGQIENPIVGSGENPGNNIVEEPKVEEPFTSEQGAKILAEDEAFLKPMSTKDKLLELYRQADERFQLKVKSIDDTVAEKLAACKAKAKKAIAESKIFKKIKQITDNIAAEAIDSGISIGRGSV